MRIAKLILSSVLTLIFLGSIAGAILFYEIKKDLPDVESLKTVELKQPMQIFTADHQLIGEIGEQRRIPVPLEDIPKGLIDALIATEDSRFYEHFGLDPVGIMRALSVAIAQGGARQGASTITQQVARNFFLTREKTLIRKVKEAILAIEIEQHLTKDEILNLYLNKIYLGNRAYGVAAAAQTYFGKKLNQLTLSEMAVIAGLPKAPSTLNPVYSVKRAEERRNVVLGRMLEMNFIDKAQYEQAKAEPIMSHYHGVKLAFHADYVSEMVRQEMVKQFGEEEAYTKGYKVYTTILSKDQKAAQNAVRENLIAYDMRHGYRKPAYLWKENETPWSENKIQNYLKGLYNATPFVPAGVLAKQADESLLLLLANGEKVTLNKSAQAWAKKHKPQVGDLIWIRQVKGNWQLGQIPEANSALVSLNSDDGAIEALVGGFSFSQSKFNRATQALVQVGSVIKPFIYAAAFDRGLTLATLLQDSPLILKQEGQADWRPLNSPNRFDGPMRIRKGLGLSKNMIAIRTIKMAGIPFTGEFLQRFGFKPNQYFASASLALGTASFTPLELARAYAVLDNGGFLIDPYLIAKIEDNNGNEIFSAQPKLACPTCDNIPVIYDETQKIDALQEDTANSEIIDDEGVQAGNAIQDLNDGQDIKDITPVDDEMVEQGALRTLQLQGLKALDPYSANFMQEAQAKNKAELQKAQEEASQYAPRVLDGGVAFLLRSALNTAIYGETGQNWLGTSWRIRQSIKRSDLAGKTGTTNQNKVAWYAGFGANITTAIYIGFDNNARNLGRGEYGASAAMPAWVEYMKTALKDVPERQLPLPSNIITRQIDPESGLLASPGEKGLREYFIKGTEPKRIFVPQNRGYLPSMSTEPDTSNSLQQEELF